MKMKTISTEQKNAAVLVQLQEYAQLYFDAIIDVNTDKYGKCDLKQGRYSASELEDNGCNSILGRAWEIPTDTMFDEDITIEVGTFKCTFPYRKIFSILSKWETMMRAGRQKAVFEIGSVEERSAKVLLDEKTELGNYKEKRIKLQRIAGNWWMPRKLKKCEYEVNLYYELNGVFFIPGKRVQAESLQDDATKEWCDGFGDEKIIELLNQFLTTQTEARSYGYFSDVARRANIKAAETAQISTETAGTVDCAAESKSSEIEPQTPSIDMETTNITTAIQIATANKFFSREQHKHAEMPCKLSINGNVIFFYWAAAKRIVGKTHSCQYHFYPDHYEITKCIYNQYGCFLERTTRHEYIATKSRPDVQTYKVHIATPPTNAPQSTGTTETVDCAAEGETTKETANMPQFFNCEWELIEDFKKMPNISKLAKAGIIVNCVGWHTEYLDQTHNVLARVDNLPWDNDRCDFPYQGSGVFGKTELYDNWKDAVIATIDALTEYLQRNTTEVETAYIQPHNIRYFVDNYGDIKTLGRAYYNSAKVLIKERFKYKDNIYKAKVSYSTAHGSP